MTQAFISLPGRNLQALSSTDVPGNFKFTRFLFGLPVFEFPANLLGGKGGFGSLLRSQKHWAKQTTNFDSSRDLSGQRLRQSRAAERLSGWVEEQRRDDAIVAELQPETSHVVARESLPQVFVEELKLAGKDKKRLISDALNTAPVDKVVPVKKLKRTKLDLEISSSSDPED